jgi:hypothetical protein
MKLEDGNDFMVASNPDVIDITFKGASYELSHERAQVLAQTLLDAIEMWK